MVLQRNSNSRSPTLRPEGTTAAAMVAVASVVALEAATVAASRGAMAVGEVKGVVAVGWLPFRRCLSP